jgi:hypothetical protein
VHAAGGDVDHDIADDDRRRRLGGLRAGGRTHDRSQASQQQTPRHGLRDDGVGTRIQNVDDEVVVQV